MKKVMLFVQVVLVLLLIAGIFYTRFVPSPPLDYEPDTWKSWNGFLAISYRGIMGRPTGSYMSRDIFLDQITALKTAGYKTVNQDDVVKFLERRRPLPDNALLIMFEGSRKDSFLYATPILEKNGMFAHIFIPTNRLVDPTQRRGGFYLKERGISRVAKHTNWFVGSYGHEALWPIEIDETGNTGHFLAKLKWLDAGRLENRKEFETRVSQDYITSAKMIQDITGVPAIAYLYPYADTGIAADSYPEASVINQSVVEQNFRMAFVNATNPLNSMESDPYRLNRLLVPPDWSGNRLVQELANFKPRMTPITGFRNQQAWLQTGRIQRVGFELDADASIWLRGSDTWSDVNVTAKFRLNEASRLVLFLRYGDYNSFLRITIDKDIAAIQERRKDSSYTLANKDLSYPIENDYSLTTMVKGNRLWLWINRVLAAGPVPVSRLVQAGRIGFNCQGEPLQLLDFSASQIPKSFVFGQNFDELESSRQQNISGVLPVWYPQRETSKTQPDQPGEVTDIVEGVETEALPGTPKKTGQVNVIRSRQYAVHTGLFSVLENAEDMVTALEQKKFPTFTISFTKFDGTEMKRVLVGPYAFQSEAHAALQRLKQADLNGFVWILNENQVVTFGPLSSMPEKKEPYQFMDEDVMAAAAESGQTYAVQVGEFASLTKATNLESELRTNGFSAFRLNVETTDGKKFIQVLVGPFALKDTAERSMNLLEEQGLRGSLRTFASQFLIEKRGGETNR